MIATGVPYENEINLAAAQMGVDPALLQSVINVAGTPANPAGLPQGEPQEYAREYAAVKLRSTTQNESGFLDPESNIVAAAWWLRVKFMEYGDEWSAVAAYFGGGPRGVAYMRRVHYSEYPKWKRAFGG